MSLLEDTMLNEKKERRTLSQVEGCGAADLYLSKNVGTIVESYVLVR